MDHVANGTSPTVPMPNSFRLVIRSILRVLGQYHGGDAELFNPL